ncbi:MULTISPECIES: OmpA family protein [unclassified Aureispira]|uniref:OmpA family protein n=1 Tax=unclassified Aureispira TaxID=2649989 RepID=UPI000695B007|nr:MULTISPECIES: OmpA family protein [unclassified Aureispira]WMX12653.1 OmpA family protein [Aureispira sp. CCB-E]
MQKYFNYCIILFFFGSLLSCVPNRKFQEEVSAKTKAQQEASQAKQSAEQAQEELELAQKEIQKIEKELQELDKDYTLIKTRYDQQEKLNKDLQILYDKVLAVNEKLTQEAAGKSRELTEEVTRKQEEIRRKEDEIRRREREMADMKQRMDQERAEIERLQKDLEDKNANIDNLQGDKSALEKSLKAREEKVAALESSLAAREKRVKELEDAIASRDAKAKALKDKLSQALLGFESSDLSVEQRNGKVYVSLSQNLLFATGSARLDSKGAGAITKLAEVLNKNNEINVLVEGHTDSDGDEKMNWELSTKRSLSIVDQLIKNKVKPSRITAAGRGEHVPIASNDTEAGKAKNRRTEIILSPQLDEIMNILKN